MDKSPLENRLQFLVFQDFSLSLQANEINDGSCSKLLEILASEFCPETNKKYGCAS